VTRTAEQTEIAWFWSNDRDGTYKPPGHLNNAVQIIAAQEGLNILQEARLLALLNLAPHRLRAPERQRMTVSSSSAHVRCIAVPHCARHRRDLSRA
jgi:hypothetical protein